MAHNICIDGLFLTRPYSWCGINRYLVNILRRMGSVAAREDGPAMNVLVPSNRSEETYGLNGREGLTFVSCPAMRLQKLWSLGVLFGGVKKLKADALFLPAPAPLCVKPLPLAVTVHDIIPILFPSEFSSFSGHFLRRSVLMSIHKADVVLTDSEHSKKDLIATQGIPPDKVVVASLGFNSELFNAAPADLEVSRKVLQHYDIRQPYLLHVGVIEPRKNVVRLTQAYRALLRRRRGLRFQLVLCGRTGWAPAELLRLLREPDLQGRVVLTGPVPDQELAILYKNSLGCAMPSLYEGFGLPLLEAMASGIPVISSDRSCLPEIGGDAPAYFNPESIEEICTAMERVLEDSERRSVMVQRGLERAKLFSWEDCASKTLGALRNL